MQNDSRLLKSYLAVSIDEQVLYFRVVFNSAAAHALQFEIPGRFLLGLLENVGVEMAACVASHDVFLLRIRTVCYLKMKSKKNSGKFQRF